MGDRADEPLFLQIKEAQESVLAPFAGLSESRHEGERVVNGQRLMQAAGDVFLGWTSGIRADGVDSRDYYVRQLRDMKGAMNVPAMDPEQLTCYAGLCGWTLARGHARTGRASMIAGYLGTSDRFDQAIEEFSVALRQPERGRPSAAAQRDRRRPRGGGRGNLRTARRVTSRAGPGGPARMRSAQPMVSAAGNRACTSGSPGAAVTPSCQTARCPTAGCRRWDGSRQTCSGTCASSTSRTCRTGSTPMASPTRLATSSRTSCEMSPPWTPSRWTRRPWSGPGPGSRRGHRRRWRCRLVAG